MNKTIYSQIGRGIMLEELELDHCVEITRFIPGKEYSALSYSVA